MPVKRPKRPRDFNQFAKRMVDLATGNAEEKPDTALTKRARAGGKKGGPARSVSLAPEQRAEIARMAAEARWKRSKT